MGEVKKVLPWHRDAVSGIHDAEMLCRDYNEGLRSNPELCAQIIASHAPAEVMSADELWERHKITVALRPGWGCWKWYQWAYVGCEPHIVEQSEERFETELACRAAAAKWAEERGGGA